jgi:cystathionine beta-lyase/cystathionine gamma-synthase
MSVVSMATQVVIHSCTKFLGGHSDILAGSVSVGSRHLEDKVWQARKLVLHNYYYPYNPK